MSNVAHKKNSLWNKNSEKVISFSFFLIPGLLLWTPNFTVVIAFFIVLFSIYYCYKNFRKIKITNFDKLAILCLSAYFLSNIPNVILDFGNFRYLDGPSKILICIPLYIMLKNELPNFSTRKSLELGLFFGSLGAFFIAIIQFFILNYPRVDGFLFSINFGYLSCSLAFLNLSFSVGSNKPKLLIFGFALALVATLLTLTRGAIFAIPLLFIFFLYIHQIKFNYKKALSLLSIFILTTTLAYNLSAVVKERSDFTIHEFKSILGGDLDSARSTGARFQLWYAALQAAQINPIYGLSYDEREELNRQLFKQGEVNYWVTTVSRGHAHSQYFEMLASTGLVSVIAVSGMIIFPMIIFVRHRQNFYAQSGAVFIAGISIFGFTEALLQANLISVYFGVFLAFFLAAISEGEE